MSYTVGVVVHPTRPVDGSVREILAWVGVEHRVLGRETDRERLGPDVTCVDDDAFTTAVDAVVALGGDGTMLGALRLVARRPVPVLGVNHGHLGFLVEIDPAGLGEALSRRAAGSFTVETHPGLAVGDRTAFNDVCLIRPGTTGSISVDLAVHDERYGYYRADAVVVATPSGSTAYNYGAGGPVLSPSVSAVVVTPVAPISGVSRSIVFDGEDVITLTPDGAAAELQLDGVPSGRVEPGEAVTVQWVREAASVVRFDAPALARRNNVVLSLRDLPLRPDQLLELVPADMRDRLPRRHE